MITITKTAVFPTGGTPDLFSIGTGLSRMPRFAGQTRHWYPVLAHVITCAYLIDEYYRVYALLHDAAEAVVGDQVKTWKNPSTSADEDMLLERITRSIGLEWPWPEEAWDRVHEVDLVALRAEAYVLGHSTPDHKSFREIPYSLDAQLHTKKMLETTPGEWIATGYGGALYSNLIIEELQKLDNLKKLKEEVDNASTA